jgi:hypothetical protein
MPEEQADAIASALGESLKEDLPQSPKTEELLSGELEKLEANFIVTLVITLSASLAISHGLL